MRYKYRLRFEKNGALCFLGHLDLLKVFQRAVRRAGLPVAYSSGFNPHQQMGFALPLPLGMAGYGEYLDLELARPVPPETTVSLLNGALPEGLRLNGASVLAEGEKSAAALVERAAYAAYLVENVALAARLDALIAGILAEEQIVTVKKTKGGMKEADIRQDIVSLTNESDGGALCLGMVLAAGSARNLKAEAVVACLYQRAGISYDPLAVRYIRRALLFAQDRDEDAVWKK